MLPLRFECRIPPLLADLWIRPNDITLRYRTQHRMSSARWHRWCHKTWSSVRPWPVQRRQCSSRSLQHWSPATLCQLVLRRCYQSVCANILMLHKRDTLNRWPPSQWTPNYSATLHRRRCWTGKQTSQKHLKGRKRFLLFFFNKPTVSCRREPRGKVEGRQRLLTTGAVDTKLDVYAKTWKVKQPSFLLCATKPVLRAP